MGRGCMLILALGLLAVCFAEEGPTPTELDQAKSFMKQIKVDTKPLAKMLPLEKDAEKQMSGVIASFGPSPDDGSPDQVKAERNEHNQGPPQVDESGASEGPMEELGEALEGDALTDAAGAALSDIKAAKVDETKQELAANLAMKRIHATLADMKSMDKTLDHMKNGGNPTEAEMAQDDRAEAQDDGSDQGPKEELGEEWAPVAKAEKTLENVYATLKKDTAVDTTHKLLNKMDKEAVLLNDQVSGELKADAAKNQDGGKGQADGGKGQATDSPPQVGPQEEDEEDEEELGDSGDQQEDDVEEEEELGETKAGALSDLEKHVDAATSEQEKPRAMDAGVAPSKAEEQAKAADEQAKAADADASQKTAKAASSNSPKDKDSLLKKEQSEMKTLEKQAAVVKAAEKADEKEVNSLIQQLS